MAKKGEKSVRVTVRTDEEQKTVTAEGVNPDAVLVAVEIARHAARQKSDKDK